MLLSARLLKNDVHRPANLFTARFVGGTPMNLLPARIGPDAAILLDGTGTSLRMPARADGRRDGAVVLGVRPEDITIGGTEVTEGLVLQGTVSALEPLGAETLVHIDTGHTTLVGRVSGRRSIAIGDAVRMHAPSPVLHFFDATSGEAIRS